MFCHLLYHLIGVLLGNNSAPLTDCLVKVEGAAAAFKTIEEQNEHFAEEMKLMAREGHDDEDGWKLATRFEQEELDVHERKVEWSSTVQLRSRWTARCDPQKLANFILFDESTQLHKLNGKFMSESCNPWQSATLRMENELLRLTCHNP